VSPSSTTRRATASGSLITSSERAWPGVN
jgi:hypothetical protein